MKKSSLILLSLILLLGVVAGCGYYYYFHIRKAPSVAVAPPATPAPAPAIARDPAPVPGPGTDAKPMTSQSVEAVVIQAVSGDCLEVQESGSRRIRQVRLIGIDAPVKASREQSGQEPWGTRSQQTLALMVIRKKVRLEFDVVIDKDGRTRWAWVWLGDRLINEEMVREGLAVLNTQPPNVQYTDRLTAGQTEAREKQKGVWDPALPLDTPPSQFVSQHLSPHE
ncbi:MAG: thermonuclease family protein [Verrucomicrobiae bacterium]|nr:thermonuclease family protein [Verrucomicrobiae bacterium]